MKGIISIGVANYLTKFLVFSAQLMVSLWLTPTELGLLKTVQSYIEILAVFSTFGLHTAILYHLPKQSDKSQVKTKETALAIVLLISLLVLLISNIAINILYFDESKLQVTSILVWATVFLALSNVVVAIYQSEQKFYDLSKIIVVSKFFSVIILLCLTYKFSIVGYSYAIVIGAAITFFSLFYMLPYSKLVIKSIDINVFYELMKVGVYSLSHNMVGIISLYSGLIVLNVINVNPSQIGYYSFALIIISAFEVLTATAQQYFLPKYSSYYSLSEALISYSKKIERKYYIFTLLVTIFSLSVIMLLKPYLGEFKYFLSIDYIIILILTWYGTSFYSLKNTLLISCKKNGVILMIISISSIFSLFTAYFMGLSYGGWGVILGRAIYVICNIFMYNVYYKCLINKDIVI